MAGTCPAAAQASAESGALAPRGRAPGGWAGGPRERAAQYGKPLARWRGTSRAGAHRAAVRPLPPPWTCAPEGRWSESSCTYRGSAPGTAGRLRAAAGAEPQPRGGRPASPGPGAEPCACPARSSAAENVALERAPRGRGGRLPPGRKGRPPLTQLRGDRRRRGPAASPPTPTPHAGASASRGQTDACNLISQTGPVQAAASYCDDITGSSAIHGNFLGRVTALTTQCVRGSGPCWRLCTQAASTHHAGCWPTPDLIDQERRRGGEEERRRGGEPSSPGPAADQVPLGRERVGAAR